MADLPDVTGPSDLSDSADPNTPVGPPAALSPVITASTHWLARAYPADDDGAVSATLVELQARQAVTVAAWLRYPSVIDAELVAITGPGGSAVLDWRVGTELDEDEPDDGWRSWVDEVVVSWAAALLADPALAARAVTAVLTPIVPSSGVPSSGVPSSVVRTSGAPSGGVPDHGHRPRPYPPRVGGAPVGFRRLTAPNARDRAAATLLRHPDLLAAIADPHRAALVALLRVDRTDA